MENKILNNKQSLNLEGKTVNNTELMDIFKNILETDSNDGKIIKRRNSFTGKNIFQEIKKEKQIEKNKKVIQEIKIEQKPEIDKISNLESNKNSLSSSKLEINLNIQNIESKNSTNNEKLIQLSKLKRDKSYNTLKNNQNKIKFNEKSSNVSTSLHKNFVLKSELFKTDNSCGNPKENEKNEKNLLLLLTNKSENQKENQFYKYFIGDNLDEKIDFKKNNENKKNIFSYTYVDNDEEEINAEKNKFKSMIINNFDDKSFKEQYSLKKNLNYNENKKEEESQKIKLQEKVINLLKSENPSNSIDNYKDLNSNRKNGEKYSNLQNEKNINLIYPNNQENKMNLNQYNIQNNYINNNYNIHNHQKFINLNQGYYYPLMNPYQNFYNVMNPYIYQNNNQMLFNPYLNNNGQYNQYNINNVNFYPMNNNVNKKQNKINNQNIYNTINNLNDIQLAKMSLNLLKTQVGFQILETKIKSDSNFANDLLFPELRANLPQICCDLYGNFLIQCLLDNLSFDNLNIFLSLIQEQIFSMCLIENGSRVIQKLIDKIYTYPILINKFIYYLGRKDIGIIFKSAYGNHLIQKYLTIIKDFELNNFIYNYLYKNFMDIVLSKYGVCVIQKGLSEGNDSQRKKIIELILDNLDKIIKDCYGNFLIQYIFFKFDKNKFNEILPIIENIEKNIVDFCTSKFSSSVIEKCLEKNEIIIGTRIINCLCEYNLNSFVKILLNPYGKYVIKKSFNFNNNMYRNNIMNIILNNIDKIEEFPEGKKIIESIRQEYLEFSILLMEKGISY